MFTLLLSMMFFMFFPRLKVTFLSTFLNIGISKEFQYFAFSTITIAASIFGQTHLKPLSKTFKEELRATPIECLAQYSSLFYMKVHQIFQIVRKVAKLFIMTELKWDNVGSYEL